jgi:hypothetical protein
MPGKIAPAVALFYWRMNDVELQRRRPGPKPRLAEFGHRWLSPGVRNNSTALNGADTGKFRENCAESASKTASKVVQGEYEQGRKYVHVCYERAFDFEETFAGR